MIVLAFVALVLLGVVCWSVAAALWVGRSPATGSPDGPRKATTGRRIALGAFVGSIAIAAIVLGAPMGESATISSDTAGTMTTTTTSVRLIDHEGLWLLAIVAVPVNFAGLAAFVRGRREHTVRLTCGVILLLVCLVGIVTLGLFFLPVAIATTVAGACTPRLQRNPLIADAELTRT